MQTHLSHVQINVNPANLAFYRDLMAFFGWRTIYGDDTILGVVAQGPALWFTTVRKEVANDYDGLGMNHVGIGVAAQADVDTVAGYLKERGVALLFDTPRHRPEFSASEHDTYYQIMFESPDRVLFEVVYEGPKA